MTKKYDLSNPSKTLDISLYFSLKSTHILLFEEIGNYGSSATTSGTVVMAVSIHHQ